MIKKKILLIGGCGFIGHNLAIALKKKGADVYVLDSLQVNHIGEHTKSQNANDMYLSFLNQRINLLKKYKIPLHIVDARDYQILTNRINLIKPDTVIHLAAVAHAKKANKDPYSTLDHSMRTLENTLDAIRGTKTHFIFFSSSMVYGHFKKKKVRESEPCEPLGIYGAIKFGGEKLVIAYGQVFGLNYTIVRPSALYGPRCVSRRVGQVFIENAIASKDLILEGDGSDSLDFTYIDDLINGLELIISSKNSYNEIFNLTYGKAEKIKILAETVAKFFPQIGIKYSKRDKLMPFRGTLDITNIKKKLGFTPSYPIFKGLELYINWYKEDIDRKF